MKDTTTIPTIILGQDECVFQQYHLHSKQWIGPHGERALLPKTQGYGMMVSGFTSREFGFGMELSAEELKKVNTKSRRKKYMDMELK